MVIEICNTGESFSSTPIWFKIAIPGEGNFIIGVELHLPLMFPDGIADLQVDDATINSAL